MTSVRDKKKHRWKGPLPKIRLLKYPQGTEILDKETGENIIYCLVQGTVSVRTPNRKRAKVLKQIGEIFGDSCVSGHGYNESVTSLTQIDVLCVAAADLDQYSELDSAQLQQLLKDLFSLHIKNNLELNSKNEVTDAIDNRDAEADNCSDAELKNIKQELKNSHQRFELVKAQLGRITTEFKRFVQKPLLDRMASESISGDYDTLRPGHHPEEEELTILFSDIRSFSTLSEMMTSEETFDFLNSYMLRMEPCISSNGGYIDKLIGDAVMAIFKSVDDAVSAAIAMEEAVIEYNRKRMADGRNPISTGIGINTGPVMLGLLGTMVHLDSTVIGDAVNLASRLESLTKSYGVRILISEFSYDKLVRKEYCRLIDRVHVKGREAPAGVYEVFGFGRADIMGQKKASQPVFERAYELYLQRDFRQARELFQECCETCPRDIVSRVYTGRCEYLIEHTPEVDWDGIFEKRASRFTVGNQPAKLFFEHSLHDISSAPIRVSNMSQTGIMIYVEHDHELYIGERLLLEFATEFGANEITLIMTCQVMRGKTSKLPEGDACLEYGLEFYEMTWPQKKALHQVLELLSNK